MKIRVVIGDDHQILVVALETLLAGTPDIEVVGDANDGPGVLKLVEEIKPDVLILDIGMPGMNGIETTQRLVGQGSKAKIIILSGYSDKRFVVEALNAGAIGYVVKSSAAEELPRAIRAVAAGQTYLCPEVAGAVVDSLRAKQAEHVNRGASVRLAPRERVVVRLIAEGKTSVEIAVLLHIAPSTAETHRRNVMRKLDLHSVADLTRYAIREGMTVA